MTDKGCQTRRQASRTHTARALLIADEDPKMDAGRQDSAMEVSEVMPSADELGGAIPNVRVSEEYT